MPRLVRATSLAACLLAACSLPTPTEAPIVAPAGRAPGSCGEVTRFAYVGTSTLKDLGLAAALDVADNDAARRGRFWITSAPLDLADRLAQAREEEIARAARAGERASVPPAGAERPAQRMLCVEWADRDSMGLTEMSVPDDWTPPAP